MTPTSPLYVPLSEYSQCTNPLCELPLTLKRLQNHKQESAKSVAFQLQELHSEKPKTPWPPSLHFPRAPLPNTIPDIIVSIAMNRNTGKRLPSLKGFV